jgi:cation diffusion facilitator family transporter
MDDTGTMGSASVASIEERERTRAVRRVLITVLTLNMLVAVAKFIFGYATHTGSIQSDGIHSLFDSCGNLVGIIGISIAARPADYNHPYGHAKFEAYASAIIGALLLIAAWEIASRAIVHLVSGTASPDVSLYSFIVMLGTLAVNVSVTAYERRSARRLSSEILGADAHHTLSDVLVTCGVLVGLVFIRLGFPVADPIMSLVVAVAILASAVEVFKGANASLSDTNRIPAAELRECVQQVEGVRGCHKVRTRGTETAIYLDLHVLVDPDMTVREGHELANRVECRVRETYPAVRDVVVHIEPDDDHQRTVSVRQQVLEHEELNARR